MNILNEMEDEYGAFHSTFIWGIPMDDDDFHDTIHLDNPETRKIIEQALVDDLVNVIE